jgi:hypothetical protein
MSEGVEHTQHVVAVERDVGRGRVMGAHPSRPTIANEVVAIADPFVETVRTMTAYHDCRAARMVR